MKMINSSFLIVNAKRKETKKKKNKRKRTIPLASISNLKYLYKNSCDAKCEKKRVSLRCCAASICIKMITVILLSYTL